MAQTVVLDGTSTFLALEHLPTDRNSLQDAVPAKSLIRADASDSTDYTERSKEDRSKQQFVDKCRTAHDSGSVRTVTREGGKLPHEAVHYKDREETLSMSWWPIPDALMMAAETPFNEEYNEGKNVGRPRTKGQPSIFKRLETCLAGFVHSHHNEVGASSPNGDVDKDTRNAMAGAPVATLKLSNESDSLYHVLLTTSHQEKDVKSKIQGVKICGTFDSLPVAKAFAHRCLFSVGYEQEWFTTFHTQNNFELIDHEESKIVEATGPAGEVFTVTISTIPNTLGLKSSSDSKHITLPLYHVVQTIVHYRDDESGQTRDTTVQGSYVSEERAREVAHTLLLWFEDGIDRETYMQYEEAGPGELDCGYGENVVVHAVGQDGENYLVSILKGEEIEAESLG